MTSLYPLIPSLTLGLTLSLSFLRQQGGGAGGYVAKGVHFDISTYLLCAALTATENGKFSFSYWVNLGGKVIGDTEIDGYGGQGFTFNTWSVDPFSNYPGGDGEVAPYYPDFTDYRYFVDAALLDYSKSIMVYATPNTAFPAGWFNICGAGDANRASGSKLGCLLLNGVSIFDGVGAGYALPINDPYAAFIPVFNGLPFAVGGANGPPFFDSDMADFQFWCGNYIDFTDASNLAKIISGGKPVDPMQAASAFGAQTVLLAGDSTTFASNQGNGGAFVTTGALSNASTSPSD